MIACLLGIQLCGFQFSGSQLHAANMPGKPTGNERIFLHHKGAVSLFAADKLKEAVEASVDGDTLFLTNGNYGSQAMSNGKEIYYGAKPITTSKSYYLAHTEFLPSTVMVYANKKQLDELESVEDRKSVV